MYGTIPYNMCTLVNRTKRGIWGKMQPFCPRRPIGLARYRLGQPLRDSAAAVADLAFAALGTKSQHDAEQALLLTKALSHSVEIRPVVCPRCQHISIVDRLNILEQKYDDCGCAREASRKYNRVGLHKAALP